MSNTLPSRMANPDYIPLSNTHDDADGGRFDDLASPLISVFQ